MLTMGFKFSFCESSVRWPKGGDRVTVKQWQTGDHIYIVSIYLGTLGRLVAFLTSGAEGSWTDTGRRICTTSCSSRVCFPRLQCFRGPTWVQMKEPLLVHVCVLPLAFATGPCKRSSGERCCMSSAVGQSQPRQSLPTLQPVASEPSLRILSSCVVLDGTTAADKKNGAH